MLKQQWFVWSKDQKIDEVYDMENKKVLGSGIYGQVIKVKDKQKQIRAIRIIPKTKIKNPTRFKYEVNQMRILIHENVVRIYESYEDARNIYLVMDYCDGGTLYQKILERHVLTMQEAKQIFIQIIRGIQICHKYAICHRDLRPESFIYASRRGDDIQLKAVDFGFSLLFVDDYIKKIKGQVVETSRQGKLYYIAPEILQGRCNETCDIWSAGVMLHVLLTGVLPFNGTNDLEIIQSIQDYSINIKLDGTVQDLLKKVLQPVEKRISILDILKHPWILDQGSDQAEFLNINFNEMKLLTKQNQLKKIMMNYISEQVIDTEALKSLYKKFEDEDLNNQGFLSIEQVQNSFKQSGYLQEFHEVIAYLQYDEDGVIIQCLQIDLQNQIKEKMIYLQEERIYLAFKKFDISCNGKISNENLWKILTTNEQFKHLSKEFCQSLIVEVDKNNDGEIDYLEFIDMFFKKQ
ncbi:hypothetical protein pb186bvf_004150 [Paramecium bursaria]